MAILLCRQCKRNFQRVSACFLFLINMMATGCGQQPDKIGTPFNFPESLKDKPAPGPTISAPQKFWNDLQFETKRMADARKRKEWFWPGTAMFVGQSGDVIQHTNLEMVIERGMNGHLRHLLAKGGVWPELSWEKLWQRQFCLSLKRSFGLSMLQLEKAIMGQPVNHIQLKYGPFRFEKSLSMEKIPEWLRVEAETAWGEKWQLEGEWKNRLNILLDKDKGEFYIVMTVPRAILQSLHRNETHLSLCLANLPEKDLLGPNLIYFKKQLKSLPSDFYLHESWMQYFEYQGSRLLRAFGLENTFVEEREIQSIQKTIKNLKSRGNGEEKNTQEIRNSVEILENKMKKFGPDAGVWLLFTKDQWTGELLKTEWPSSPFIMAYFEFADLLGQLQTHLKSSITTMGENISHSFAAVRPGEKMWLKIGTKVMKKVPSSERMIHVEGKVKICQSSDLKFNQCRWVPGWCSVIDRGVEWRQIPWSEANELGFMDQLMKDEKIRIKLNNQFSLKENLGVPFFYNEFIYWPLEIPQSVGPITIEFPTTFSTGKEVKYGWVRDVDCGHRQLGSDFSWLNYQGALRTPEQLQLHWQVELINNL